MSILLLVGCCIFAGLTPLQYRRGVAKTVAPIAIFSLVLVVASGDRLLFAASDQRPHSRWLRLLAALAVGVVVIAALSVGAVLFARIFNI